VGLLALVVLVGGVLGVVALAGAIAGDGRPEQAASGTPSPTPSASPSPTASVGPGYQPVACTSSALGITDTTATAAGTVAPGAPVPFDLVVTNTGSVPCLVDAGAASLGVILYSGTDRIWSSLDCPPEGAAAERRMLLDVAATVELSTSWDQKRSAPGCPEGQQAALPGAYRAVVTTDGGGSAALTWTRTFTIGEQA
jgi:hypothetical protein